MIKLTRMALNATLPLLRKDSEIHRISDGLWGIYTPSTGVSSALWIGTKEECEEKLKERMQ